MISVLYVDDNPALLDVGKLYLERTGRFRVDTKESAAEALEVLTSSPYDVVLSDYQMEGMDGIMFLKVVWRAWPDLPFIIFTSKRREEIVIEALNCGADHYLQKGGEPKSQFAEMVHILSRAVE